MKITFGNRAFRYVTGIYLLSWLVVQTVSTIVIYYMTYWLRKPDMISVVILAVQGSALIWLFIWTRVSDKVGKKGVYYRGMIFWIVVSFGLFIVQPAWPSWVIIVMGVAGGHRRGDGVPRSVGHAARCDRVGRIGNRPAARRHVLWFLCSLAKSRVGAWACSSSARCLSLGGLHHAAARHDDAHHSTR